ncbi:hypothetical protein KDN34_05560 [Shewanella yunxiaonensis]|uniref:Cobalamin adenosyltransferase n=1 Tax=Shewanella yunxiaonensis TaxID=2829809 RepID=A0ABX7YW24_9GAMM|nr:hypothetical protein [Shewanella yunxiaonensis]QUN06912.1 hypothetical protein KDN34_05560 [Shewanella yunxiaonensis]
MNAEVINFPWQKELEKTVVQSLTTTFGLDFLLFEDKIGGDVDTINNVRNGVHATDAERNKFQQKEEYNSTPYHQHKDYIQTGRSDKESHRQGKLDDGYRAQTMSANELGKRDLDHVMSAKEIHEDAGRVLAELDGVELANQRSNLKSTHQAVNRSKGKSSVSEYLDKLPNLIEANEKQILADESRLASMPRNTPEEQHKARELQDKIQSTKDKVAQLKSVDPEKMRQADKEARDNYNQQINQAYYTSSKFLTSTAKASGIAGLKMGARQVLGLVLAEIWFELRKEIPKIYHSLKDNFQFDAFIEKITNTLKNIWKRVKQRFSDFLTSFKDGFLSGVMGSLTTTLFNVFATTQKQSIKIIREIWSHIIKAIKVLIFNPENLSFVELCKSVVSILSLAISTVLGSITYAQLTPILTFPLGAELAAFAGALVTGIVTLGLNYFLLHSEIAQKIWSYIESIMPHAGTLKKYQAINEELDRYLLELSKLEFNLDPSEIISFSNQLSACNEEVLKSSLIAEEIKKRNIALPFAIGNTASTKQWLDSLVKK